MNPKNIYKLYFSYGWNYRASLEEVLRSLRSNPDFPLLPYHFPSQERYDRLNETELYRLVRDKIKHCDAVILLCGVYRIETYSRWIRKEIIAATGEYDKPLIAVHRYPELTVSAVVRQSADIILEWNAADLADTIKSYVGKVSP